MQFPLQSATTPSANQNYKELTLRWDRHYTPQPSLYPSEQSLCWWQPCASLRLQRKLKTDTIYTKPKISKEATVSKFFCPGRYSLSAFVSSQWDSLFQFRQMAVFLGQASGDICSGTQRHVSVSSWVTHSVVPRNYEYKQARLRMSSVLLIQLASKSSHTSLVERNMARLTKLQLLLLRPPPRLMLLSCNVCQTEMRGLQPYSTFASVATNEAPGREWPVAESFSYSTRRD